MEDKKKQSVRTDYWLQPNIVVKVITKRLGEKYHKKKAVVMVISLCNYLLRKYVYVYVGKREETCDVNSR